MEDRFGAIPPGADTLIRLARIRVAARAARIARIDAGRAAITLTPQADFREDAKELGHEMKKERLLLSEPIAKPSARLDRLETLLQSLLERD